MAGFRGIKLWRKTAALLASATCLSANVLWAQQTPSSPDKAEPLAENDIVVFGRAESKIGIAHSASEGSLAGSDLLVRPLLRTAELLEAVPGMIAAQHSGSGKANQYFLRGFNLDHGSDFTTYIDDVQMNLRTHGHGQGYLDLNGLIPEIVSREDYRKGPYHAAGGDFALAGAAYMTTITEIDTPWISGEIGSFGSTRLAMGGSVRRNNDHILTLVAQAKSYDGPWQLAERLRHLSAFGKYTLPAGKGDLSLSLHGYRGTWRPTEQVPERIAGSIQCADIFCSPDPSARGETTRFVSNVQYRDPVWKLSANAQFYDWSMYSNPIYSNADGNSAQIRQFDRRWIVGLKGEGRWQLSPWLDLTAGSENRYESIGSVGVANTSARQFVASLGDYKVKELSGSLYAQATLQPFARLRLTLGGRADYYHFQVTANDAAATAIGTGSNDASIFTPKAALAYKLSDTIEAYANWGHGFHSNDVRGAVTTTPVPVLVRGKGKELGLRYQHSKLSLTGTYWWLDVGSELKFVGDSNAVEPTGASTRHGYEIVLFWRPTKWLGIDTNYTASHARYLNGDYIPNAFENAASAGISVIQDRWEGSLRLRHLGPYPLIEDNSIRDKGSLVLNMRMAVKLRRFEIYGEVLNIANSDDKDISYYYQSYIPGYDAAPTEGRLSRPVEPRTVRVGLKFRFGA
ncbi:MAG: TonB-dependent receptor [Sphingobium sp.]|nr:TonB-dependent receptor [Sphingobium sp.]MBP8671514.1 TonB-dependent receptor [Sphingobium sp.]MBP9158029.1 TonB-dependent receptor [Sphingobium sp.]